jgi:DNA-binding transcriptional ArsR family regulator
VATPHRRFKDAVYDELARIGKATSAPKRLELLDLLCQGPRTVEKLAEQAGLSIANASRHLQVLRAARLVEAEKRGLYVEYRLADDEVCRFSVALRKLAEARLAEVEQITRAYFGDRDTLDGIEGGELMRRVRAGEVTVLDVRPVDEYQAGHIPGAISVPVGELKTMLGQIPRSREVVAYCRGPYCVMAVEAVELLRKRGLPGSPHGARRRGLAGTRLAYRARTSGDAERREVRVTSVQLGLRANLSQFSLLVLVNAFVGAMVGMERTILPSIAEQDFHLVAKTAVLSFIVVFGVTKALTNYLAGRLSDRVGRKHVLVAGWLVAAPVPFLLMWAPSWGWVLVANALLGVSQGLTWSTTVIMKIDLAGPDKRGLAMGLNEFAGYLAVAASALATGVVAAQYGLRPEPFYLGVVYVALGLLLSVWSCARHEITWRPRSRSAAPPQPPTR